MAGRTSLYDPKGYMLGLAIALVIGIVGALVNGDPGFVMMAVIAGLGLIGGAIVLAVKGRRSGN